MTSKWFFQILICFHLLPYSLPFFLCCGMHCRWASCSLRLKSALRALTCQEQGDMSVDKALLRRQRLQSTPLSQRWYKLRQRQITPAQRKTLRELWPLYGVDMHYNSSLDLLAVSYERFHLIIITMTKAECGQIFGRAAPTVLDIGFGSGDSLVALAQSRPETNILGVEIHKVVRCCLFMFLLLLLATTASASASTVNAGTNTVISAANELELLLLMRK